MSVRVRRGLYAAVALAMVAGVGVGLSVSALAAHDPDRTITIRTSGDRTSSGTSPTGGSVTGVTGVTYRVSPTTSGHSDTCTTGANGECTLTVEGGRSYTVTQVSAPSGNTPSQDNYFISQRLGVGVTGSIVATDYHSLSTGTVNSDITIPVANTTGGTTNNLARSGRWAVSRYNPPPPNHCGVNVALLFDLSESIAPNLADLKASAVGYVRALLGTETHVTLYTFGTTAPAPNTRDTNNATFGPVSTLTQTGVNSLANRINGLAVPTSPAQYTNWDAGIWQIARSAEHYEEAIVLTDGDPTAYGSTGIDGTGTARTRFQDMENGIFSANALKHKGTRVIGVGLNHSAPGSIDNIKAISGPEEKSDYFIIPFHDLSDLLKDLALAHCAGISIEKSASPETYDSPGQTITYTYRVTNTGHFTLHGVTVSDDRVGTITNCSPATLHAGQTAICTAKTTTTQADVNEGSIVNTAHAIGKTPNEDTVTSPPAKAEVIARRHPAIEITKTASPRTYDAPGQDITYTYTVKNTGNVTLTHVHFTDDKISGPFTCTPAMGSTLAPGAKMTCTATHITTQADVDAGSIANAATATGTPPDDLEPPTDTAHDEVIAMRDPAIEITKSASPTTYSASGQDITYTYTVTNTGNVTLADVHVTDDKITGPFTCTPDMGSTLAPGAVMTCTATYTTTQTDVDNGSIMNSATATGTPPDGLQHPTDTADEEIFVTGEPSIEVTKTASPQTYDAPGQTITYTYTVTNTGQFTLSDVTLADNRIAGPFDCTPTMPTSLAPAATMTCTATLTTTQADVDAGSIENTATATGTGNGKMVTDEADETVTAGREPAITIVKTASLEQYDRPGQKIAYTYTVTNTGNEILAGVSVADSKFGTITCPQTTLVPGQSMICTHTHITTQQDVDAGGIVNTATATGQPPSGPPVTDEDQETVDAGLAPRIQITKTASPATYSAPGQVIAYSYRVTNKGNVTLRHIAVVDSRLGTIACPKMTLAPGQSMTCTATHRVTAVDMDRGRIENSATATGRATDGGPVESLPAEAIVTEKLKPTVPVTG